MNAGPQDSYYEGPHMLYLIRRPPPRGIDPTSAREAPVAREWISPRYAELVAAWDGIHPPPGFVGFMDPLP